MPMNPQSRRVMARAPAHRPPGWIETWNRPRDERDDERRLYRDHLRVQARSRPATDGRAPLSAPARTLGAGIEGRDGAGRLGEMAGTRGFRGRGPRNYVRTDERIREELCEVLTEDDDIDASDISVEVRDGVVFLQGTVEERWVRHQVEDMAEACSGVRDVRNNLEVRPRETGPAHVRDGAS
jgi:BON domain-containing protein